MTDAFIEEYYLRSNSNKVHYDVNFRYGSSYVKVSDVKARSKDQAVRKAYEILTTMVKDMDQYFEYGGTESFNIR